MKLTDNEIARLATLDILCQGYLAGSRNPIWFGKMVKDFGWDSLSEDKPLIQTAHWWMAAFLDISVEQALYLSEHVGPSTSLLAQIVLRQRGDISDIDFKLVSDSHIEVYRKIYGNSPNFLSAIRNINQNLIEQLKNNPEDLYQLTPRRFEELVAEIIADMGYDVELTPQTRDGGRDILATIDLPTGRILTIVECKRFRRDRSVGIDVVERFLYTIRDKDRASCGLIASTSRFSSDALALARKYEYQVNLKDFDDLQKWLANYGIWRRDSNGGLWIPIPNLAAAGDGEKACRT